MEGEFNAMSELYKWAPDFVPKPCAWGRYSVSEPDTYFFLQQFIDMSDHVPNPDQLCKKLAHLHPTSISPNGEFGFHITTCQGSTPQCVEWDKSWTSFFTKLLKHVVDMDFATNGYWEDLSILEQRIFTLVIPRLIGNLEVDARFRQTVPDTR
jgi:fructosamine-3-kinase